MKYHEDFIITINFSLPYLLFSIYKSFQFPKLFTFSNYDNIPYVLNMWMERLLISRQSQHSDFDVLLF